ncbi:MAG: flagellin lysine-N-methylase [Candidatus Niameybacter stercoravium]|nr:flagellin lysine-N-methylase [Candidatus Niameybacter stercoravium]
MKNMEVIRRAPSYLKNFKCIGGACEDTCCAGWSIEVDEGTYKKYKKVKSSPIRTRLDKDLVDRKNKSTPEFAAKIKLKNNRCAFLSKEGWCDIYSELGESYLSHTCTLYPRTVNKINNEIEYGLTFSCPEAARVILLNETPMTFGAPENKMNESVLSAVLVVNEAKASKWQDYFKVIRQMMIEIVQDRRFNIEERLAQLGAFMLQLTKLTQQGSVKKIPGFIQEYRKKHLDMPALKSNEDCHADKQEMIRLLEKMATFRQEKKISSKRYEGCLSEAVEGLGLTAFNKETAYKLYEEGEKTYFKPFIQERDYILENYLVNYIFERCIPLDGATPLLSYERMMLYYRMLKLHLIGIAQVEKSIEDSRVITLVQSFTKTFDHNDECLKYFIK